MTIAEARDRARKFARMAGDSTAYSDADIDHAIQFVGDDFCDFTKYPLQTTSVTITAGTTTFSVSATGFTAERVLRAFISTFSVPEIVDHNNIVASQINLVTTGVPIKIGFDTPTTGEVYPTPDIGYTLKLQWHVPFTAWTIGDSSSATLATVLNLPNTYLMQLLTYGVPSALQHNEPEMKYASESWKKYLEFRERKSGAGALGAQSLRRMTLRTSTTPPWKWPVINWGN